MGTLIQLLFSSFQPDRQSAGETGKDHGEMVLVAPLWPTQHWFAKLLKLAVAQPVLLPPHHVTLILLSQPNRRHPLGKHLKLAGFRLSGKVSHARGYRDELPILSSIPGAMEPGNSMGVISANGCYFAVNNRQILFRHL